MTKQLHASSFKVRQTKREQVSSKLPVVVVEVEANRHREHSHCLVWEQAASS
jgi:hypothetical protein